MILYNYFVKKNPDVQREYERYVMEHIDEHKKHRLAHWRVLWKLNWHYRVRKKTTPLLYLNNALNTAICTKSTTSKAIESDTTNNDSKIKLPYLIGSESKLYNKKEAHYIAKDFIVYDAISFDIFDTLILRPFAKPQDLFYIIGEKLGIDSFRRIRMNAEAEAREQSQVMKGNREVTIYDIYKFVNIYTGIDIELGVKTEFEIELNLCFANPQMKRLYNLLKYQNKKIILTSDMYLPEELMKQLLNKCGYTGYDKLFVSCEYQCSKRTGGLYKHLIEYVGKDKQIMHIGDNHQVDFLTPKEYGIDSYFYKNVNMAGNMYRADNMSELIGSAYAGIVNAHLHTGIKQYSQHYEYGYIYGGLYIFGFTNWISQFAKDNNVEKIIFLSRDGNIYKRVFDAYFNDISSEYLHWSRVANMKYSIDVQQGKNYFLTRAVDDRINEELQKTPITISELLDILKLSDLAVYLKKEGLNGKLLVLEENAKMIKLFFHKHWSEIIEIYEQEESVIKSIIKNKIGNSKKIAIVDVGWNGSGPLGLKYLIETKWNLGCKVECLLAGSKVADHVANINRLNNGDLHTYLFSRMYNAEHYKIHRDSNKGMNSSFFEIFTQACEPSFSSVSTDGKYIFEIPEIENYRMIREIHQGILDFCQEYHDAFKDYPYVYNISGHDAYCPFRMITKDTKLIRRIMANFVFARNVGNSTSSFGFLKTKEMFEKIK